MRNFFNTGLLFFSIIYFSFGQSFDEALLACDQLLERLVDESKIPGLSVAVAYKNEVIWSKNYGMANLEYEAPVTDATKFRIASVSKLFTGTAIYQLHKAGQLSMDEPISQYLDSLPDSWQAITIRQIAHHISGIGHYQDVPDALDVHHYTSTKEAISKFVNRPLLHQPGQGITYSSYAYTVLAAVIEAVTGKSFEEAMSELIFEPLQMKHTETDDQKKIIKERTGFYQYDQNREPEHAPYIDLSGRWAGSGFLSTAIDLAKFGANHTFSSDVFSQQDLEILSAPYQINPSLKSKEGLGWGQRLDWTERLMYWGDGKTPGTTSGLLVFPKENLTIAIVSNMRNAPLERGEFQALSIRLLAAIEGKEVHEVDHNQENEYDLEITIGQNKLPGKLSLASKQKPGFFEFVGIQKFQIADVFWLNDELWIFAIGGGVPPIQIGIMPIRLKVNGDELGGEIFRINASVKGKKI